MGFGASRSAWLSALGAVAVAVAVTAFGLRPAPAAGPPDPLPMHLAETGLHGPGVRPFTPQYPLWTDGAKKRRFIYLPPGATIDASSPDDWRFPVGTKLWKEFSFGRAVETRYMERTAAGWRYATYVHDEHGGGARLAPSRGATTSAAIAPGVHHAVPSEGDCRVCHGSGAAGAPTPVLGFSALQLSADRDPNAPHREPVAEGAIDLGTLVEEGLLTGFEGSASARIAARSPTERAALGYLHGNCGGCHRPGGALASVGMVLASSSRSPSAPAEPPAIGTTVGRASHFAPARSRIAPGRPDESVLLERMRSRAPVSQMPPLGTQVVDEDAVRLVTQWIEELPTNDTDQEREGEGR